MDIFTEIWTWLCELIENALQWIVDLLPDSPFQQIDISIFKPYLCYINYFVPINFMIDTMLLWLGAISTYYIYSVFLRWLKTID